MANAMDENELLSLHVADLAAVPFFVHKENDFGVVRRADGLLRLEPRFLVMEFEVPKNAIDKVTHWLNAVFVGNEREDNNAGVFTVEIPLNEVEHLEVKRGYYWAEGKLYRNALMIKTKRITHLSKLPGSRGGTARLIVPKAHKHDAAALASRVMLNRSELLANNS